MENQIQKALEKLDFFNARKIEITGMGSADYMHVIQIFPKGYSFLETIGISFLELTTLQTELNSFDFKINTIYWEPTHLEIRVYKFK